MRQRTKAAWLFRLTFALPIAAAVLLLGSLGVIGIAEWCGGGALCSTLWTVFLGSAAAILGLALVIRVALLIAAALGLVVRSPNAPLTGPPSWCEQPFGECRKQAVADRERLGRRVREFTTRPVVGGFPLSPATLR
jgi:hypothetical protein